jgi:hypothetical protein
MSKSIERVQPQEVNGIEFYISNDGSQAGVSQVGLAKLIGIPETSMRRLLSDRQNIDVNMYYDDSNPDVVSGKAFAITSNQNARVVTQEACVKLITEQAMKGNKIARHSLQKFASIGFNTWVKEVVGYGRGGDMAKLQATMENLMGMVGNLSAKFDKMEEETKAYRSVVVHRQGLKEWMELEDAAKASDLLESSDSFTLAEYLRDQKKISFNKSQMGLFANKVSYIYRAMQKEAPGKKQGLRPDGRLAPATNAYTAKDLPILDLAFKHCAMEL